MAGDRQSPATLAERLAAGDRRVLGRALTAAEEGAENWQRLRALLPPAGHASVVGFTGGAGSGKSTLIDAMIAGLRRRDLTVGVAAVDPSSPFSGGAVLGDRCRMGRHQNDNGVFIRSLSARGSVGGLSAGVGRVVDTMLRCTFDVILVETVGAGQSEVDVLGLADVCVVICTPNSGDEIQAMKSGILEIADILVVNKADLAGADQAVQQLKRVRDLPSNALHLVPVLATVATEGHGIDSLIDSVLGAAKPDHRGPQERTDIDFVRRRVAHAAATLLEQHLLSPDNEDLDPIVREVLDGGSSAEEAARVWLAGKIL